ncbi:hypothetical protein [Nocardia tengchongensis]|uniref:hypothetical protein n=1 Tax=Nocardia tengchongensis TaxID=2055889 RepID=UPI00364AA4CD
MLGFGGLFAKLLGRPLPWLGVAALVVVIAGFIGFPLAATAVEFRSLRQDNGRRRAMGLTPRRVLLPARGVGLLWLSICLSWLLIVVFGVGPLLDRVVRTTEQADTAGAALAGATLGVEALLALAGVLHWRVVHPRRIRADEQRIRAADHDQLDIAPVGTRQANAPEQVAAITSTSTASRNRDRRTDIVIALAPMVIGVLTYWLAPWLVHVEHGSSAVPTQPWSTAAPLLGLAATALAFAYGYLDHTGRKGRVTMNLGFVAVMASLATTFCVALSLR